MKDLKSFLAPITWWTQEEMNFLDKAFKKADMDESIINGYWCEDFREYEIRVPPQLRDIIVFVLNHASNIIPRERSLDLKAQFDEGCVKIGGQWVKYPGSVYDFVSWLGLKSLKTVEYMRFDEFERLQILGKLNIVANGGGRWHSGQKRFDWVAMRGSENVREGELFRGIGKSYNEASLQGLITIWEVVMRRRFVPNSE